MMPEPLKEELYRLAAGLKDFVNYQRRLGLQLLEGSYPVSIVKPGTAVAASPEPNASMSLEELREEMGDCRRCKLWQSRTRLVFGVGDYKARLMFIGEAPGAEEDKQGEPFVGEAGQLLNNLLHKLGLNRQEIYITNVIKSRPPKNRVPMADEIAACRPFLIQQIAAIRPQIIVTLGGVATHALLETKTPISRLRGKWQQWQGIAVMPTFHPSYLLRVPQERKKTWDDMVKVLEIYRNIESENSG
jgi:uracil-DNA glycosylase family 4